MSGKNLQKKKRYRRLAIVLAVLLFLGASVPAALQIGVARASAQQPWRPDPALRKDISEVVKKEELSAEDYALLYEQTGLTKLGIDGFLRAGKPDRILDVQAAYFSDFEVSAEKFGPFTYWKYMEKDRMPMAPLETGDILVAPTTYVSSWWVGHMALVTDGASGETVEAAGVGYPSEISDYQLFTTRATFMVLRPVPEIGKETREKVAAYAKENLLGVKYDVTVGILSRKDPEVLTRTHCAHIVWYAYNRFGYDLDSNGGLVVVPREIACSPLLEVVQIFGLDPGKLWM